jgi:hypothetical protein
LRSLGGRELAATIYAIPRAQLAPRACSVPLAYAKLPVAPTGPDPYVDRPRVSWVSLAIVC